MEPTPFDSSSRQNEAVSTDPVKTKRRRVILAAVLSLIIIVIAVAAVYQWNHYRQQEALKNQLKKIVLEDNALVQTFLDMDDLSQITYAEYFKRTAKNKDERDELIQRIRAIEAGQFTRQANQFVKLMELENEFIRADENLSRQAMKVTTLDDTVVDASKEENDAQHELSVTTDQYYSAPYGDDYSEQFSMELAKSKVDQAQKGTVEALTHFEEERKKMIDDSKEALIVLKDWIKVEKQWYPQFAPPRDIAEELIKKKEKYQWGDGNRSGEIKGAVHDGVSSLLIVPGKSIGRVKIGDTLAIVHNVLGKPNKTFNRSGGYMEESYLSKSSEMRNGEAVNDEIKVIYSKGKVVQIGTSYPKFKTSDGYSVFSNVGQISKLNGLYVYDYSYDATESHTYYLDYQSRGISFEFEGYQDVLTWLSRPSAIIVHGQGTRVLPDVGGDLYADSTKISIVLGD
jgi:hypothetical protein